MIQSRMHAHLPGLNVSDSKIVLREIDVEQPSSGLTPGRDGRRFTLPAQPTALLGRNEELDVLSDAVLHKDIRLLTLIGPAGVGKTRLAMEVATTVSGAFPDGVVCVDLTESKDIEQFLAAIVSALQLLESDGKSPLSAVIDDLSDRRMLLVFDGFDQVLAASLCVGEIMAHCANVAVIATSRAPLHLRWEHVQPIAPLPLPDLEMVSPDQVGTNPCVRLFVERAQAIRVAFTLNASNVRDIVALCCQLDGLPLAIELAATRINVLTPAAILGRLDQQDVLLRSSAPDIPAGHQSLTAAIASNYAMLSEQEQALLRGLGVFVGGFTLETGAAVLAGEQNVDLLDGLASLVDKSVVVPQESGGDDPRFHLLQTIDLYVLEQARAVSELDRLRRAHGEYFLELAEQARHEIDGPWQDIWIARLSREYGNLKAALAWASQTDAERALRLAVALTGFWLARGYIEEGARYLSDAIMRAPDSPPTLRAPALTCLAQLLQAGGKLEQARIAVTDGLDLARSIDSPDLVAQILRWRSLHETREIGVTLRDKAVLHLAAGDFEHLNSPDTLAPRLSKREHEVVALVVQGLSNRQIAQELGISENTAKFHITSILNKLGVDSRVRIAALAAKLNLLPSRA